MQKETGIVLFMCFSIGVIVAADTTGILREEERERETVLENGW